MFGLVSQRKYNKLDKRCVLAEKELHDIRKYGVTMRKQDLDILMEDMKKLESDNEILRRQLEKYDEAMKKIFRLADGCNFNIENYKGLDTTAYWIKEEGKPFVCSKCGYSFWNGTDNYVLHCSGCGRLMTRINDTVIVKKEEK